MTCKYDAHKPPINLCILFRARCAIHVDHATFFPSVNFYDNNWQPGNRVQTSLVPFQQMQVRPSSAAPIEVPFKNTSRQDTGSLTTMNQSCKNRGIKKLYCTGYMQHVEGAGGGGGLNVGLAKGEWMLGCSWFKQGALKEVS